MADDKYPKSYGTHWDGCWRERNRDTESEASMGEWIICDHADECGVQREECEHAAPHKRMAQCNDPCPHLGVPVDCVPLESVRVGQLEAELAEWKDTAEQWKLNAEINREHYKDCCEKLERKEHIYQDCRHLAARRLSEANDLRRQLAALRADKQDDLDSLSNMLAAAEAREAGLLDAMSEVEVLLREVWRGGDASKEEAAAILRRMIAEHNASHAALKAALEQARADAFEEIAPLLRDAKDYFDHPEQKSRRAWALIERLEKALQEAADEGA